MSYLKSIVYSLILFILASFFVVSPALAAPPGAIFTSNSSCDGTNLNIYSDKALVYLDGGPAHEGAAGLPDGNYYVKVTEPNGTVLGTSVGSGNDTPVHVINGSFDICYQLSSILIKASDSTQGYDTTSNGGGEYKVWVSSVSTFDADSTKTDNFKVKENPQNTFGSISGLKWQDTNADGLQGIDEPLLPDWTIQLWDSTHTSLIDATTTDSQGFYEFNNVVPGTYQVCEVLQDSWHPSFPTTSEPDNCNTNVVVTASTATNNINFGNYQNASLTVIKHVVNDNGGTKVAGDFTMNVTAVSPSSDSFPGDESGTTISIKPGTYSVGESGPTGYAESDSTECSGTAVSGGSYTCTITNDDIAPKLTLIKTVINNNGGTKQVADFPLFINGNQVTSGVSNTVSANVLYTATETSDSGYQASSWGGDCSTNGTITLAPGDDKTCTITNDDLPAHLIVIKHVINDNGDIAVASDFTMLVTGTNVSSTSFPGSESGVTVTLDAGSFSADEASNSGYTKTLSTDCSGTIANGQTKTCTITNNDIPHATRTQGFWQTHTTYTYNTWFSGSVWTIGTKSFDSSSKLFAAFYASISKKSDGKTKRSSLDQARMLMLQQWVATKLNCAAFGCAGPTLTLLNNAATAWAGTNTNLILSFASQLDAYNNSNDALPISAQGKATPSASQAAAQSAISYWDILP